jgi:hypothetical protein
VFSKNTTLLKDINRAINNNFMKIVKIRRKYLITLGDMIYKRDCIDARPSIGLTPYSGLYLIALAIITVAFFCFFVEFGFGYGVSLKGIQIIKNLLRKFIK